MPDHSCEDNSVEVHDTKEFVCIKCGAVTKEPSNFDIYVEDCEARAMGAQDHYAGNALLNSETENMDFVNHSNQGLAYKLNRAKATGCEGRAATGLNDPYLSGCIAGGKAVVLKEDPITHEVSLKFDMYDKPMLRMIKERAMSELGRYNLNTIDMTIVAKECKRIVSRLFFSELMDYAWMAAVLNADVLKEKDALAIEQNMYELLDPIRVKLLSRCSTELVPELKKDPEPIKAQ